MSVLPVISELLKFIVHTQLYTHLNDTGMLAAEQSGFHKNYSIQTRLHKLIDNFYSDFENSKIIGMLALDLSEISLHWFRFYLENRTQMACI